MLDFPNGQITVSNFEATFACNVGELQLILVQLLIKLLNFKRI